MCAFIATSLVGGIVAVTTAVATRLCNSQRGSHSRNPAYEFSVVLPVISKRWMAAASDGGFEPAPATSSF